VAGRIDPRYTPAMRLVVMGVSGAGKSAVGERLAATLGVPFAEGDTLHPAANVAKMTAGQPLDDADRAPWLDRVAAWLGAHDAGVITCSALKRSYRDRLRAAAPDACFVLLNASAPVLRERIGNRPGHFMPAALLDSQLATLEPLDPDERGLTVRSADSVAATAAVVIARLG
jgi:gluconokinase